MTILHLDSSINGETSASRTISKNIVSQLKRTNWGEPVIYRDLVAEPLPHLTLDAFADSSVLDEFLGADTIVIGAPMYNFTLPTQLKAWLDRILVAGKTFRYTETGASEGLAGGKRVIIALARGGVYDEGSPAAGMEHLESYLRGVFGFIGIEPEFVAADGLAIGPEQRAASIDAALGVELPLAA